ncbi:MAG: diguanylate cyclase [Acidobacteria bacterium]|nr:diguanylate cyclase [Acidobacteriota bacterium]
MTTSRTRSARYRLGAILGLAAAALSGAVVFALDPQTPLSVYIHETWRREQGVSAGIRCIAQTRDGYLWLGTDDGLIRFDGVRTVRFNRRNTPGMVTGAVATLCASPGGGLWIGFLGGGLMRYEGGGFHHWGGREGLPEDSVVSLLEGPDGSLWLGTLNGGLFRFRQGRFTREGTAPGSLPHPMVTSLCQDPAGRLWIGTRKGLVSYDGRRFRAWGDPDGLPATTILKIVCDRGGRLWVTTSDSGLFRSEGDRFSRVGAESGVPDSLDGLFEDADGNIWVGTSRNGLLRYANGRFQALKTDSMPDCSVTSILEDREGSLWFGMNGGGLHRLRNGVVETWGREEGLASSYVYGLLDGGDGSVWVGTEQGVDRLVPLAGRDRGNGAGEGAPPGGRPGLWTVTAGGAGLPPKTCIVSLARDARGRLWAGTDAGSLYCRDGDRWRRVLAQKGTGTFAIPALLADGDHLWLGTFGHHHDLFRVDGPGEPPRPVTIEGLPTDANLTCLFRDRSGTLWVGTYGMGLFRVRDGRALRYADHNRFILSLWEDERGDLWVGSAGGLWRIHDGKAKVCTVREGLADDVITAILPDGGGNLWLGTQAGIGRCSLAALRRFMDGSLPSVSCTVLGRTEGMRTEDCNGGFTRAGVRLPDGTLCFSTTEGVAMVNPARLQGNLRPPPVVIEAVLCDRQPLPLFPSGDGVARVEPEKRDFEFQYTALSFVVPSKIRFRFRLEGYDTDWNEVEDRRKAYYTNLEPGRYTFRVIACNNEGVWNETGAAFAFEIVPRFRETLGFRILLGTVLVLCVAAYIHLRLWRMRRRKRELERLVRVRTEQLEEAVTQLKDANDELQRLAVTDPLTGIANRRRLLDGLEKEWRRSSRNAKPLSLVMLDVDDFKRYNDQNGHQEGDACLRKVGQAIRDTVFRPADLAGRYGGEEFGVVLAETDVEGARCVAERIRAAVEALAIPHPGSRVVDHVTVSLGVASLVPGRHTSPMELVSLADQALYRAKAEGRNRVACHRPEGGAA